MRGLASSLSAPRRVALARVALAGPGVPGDEILMAQSALIGPGVELTTMRGLAGLSVVLPEGAAGIDQIALPLALLPLVWAALFFHACLDRSLRRAALVALALCVLAGGAVAWHMAAAHLSQTRDRPR